ncbi:MAG: Zn-ribbon domain-containing OB-fold protein [Candidatus Bathyarchaeota archaeon]|nr:Zn-ribbon domain-containing OB-fold protein [Candidatus Termiticorpusculum sp.]
MSSQQHFSIDQFYQFLLQGKLMAGKCLKCGKIHLPPRLMCDECYSTQFDWTQISNKGKLLTYTVIHIGSTQFQNLVPYVVGIIEIDNGLKIPGIIHGVAQEQLKIGMSLFVDFDGCTMSQVWPQWARYCLKP